ncbi:MAG: PfkB family carbohydrate kinase [Solirubrobacteraceae bacterium]
MSSSQPKVAVVGHVEWVQFGRVGHLPAAGEVAHADGAFEEPAGGGAVAAVQLARLAGACRLFTVLGDDDAGRRSLARLAELGVEVANGVAAGHRGEAPPTRRAVTLIDAAGERTITTFGERLDPAGDADLERWKGLEGLDAVYFTAGDQAALRRGRDAARVLVASPRARHALGGGVPIDVLVLSGQDEIELRAAAPVLAEAELVVYTEGGRGGRYRRRSGEEGRWKASPVPGEVVDSYGCGDSFAAGLTYGLGAGLALGDALAIAARCGAECLTGAGPYTRQLSGHELYGQET